MGYPHALTDTPSMDLLLKIKYERHMTTDRLTAIILAAGLSSRMGRFKPLLPLGETTVVERVVGLYRDAGVEDICVVLGHRAGEVTAVLEPHGVRFVVNRQFEEGMFSSIQEGMRALPDGCRGFFVHPVDVPLVRKSTVVSLVEAFTGNDGDICHPGFDGRRGHPPLVPAALASEILDWPGEGGLRGCWSACDMPMRDVAVADQGILWDLDTEEDYQLILARLLSEDIPTVDECHALMSRVLRVPDAVQQHCRAVATVAVRLATALRQAGLCLDIDLLRSAALVHDIAREVPDHAMAGAKLLEDLDFSRLAGLVRVHMDMAVGPDPSVDEAGVLYFADKLVVGHRLADLDERFERKLVKYGKDAGAIAAIEKRRDAAKRLQVAIERICGQTVDALLSGIDIDGEFAGG